MLETASDSIAATLCTAVQETGVDIPVNRPSELLTFSSASFTLTNSEALSDSNPSLTFFCSETNALVLSFTASICVREVDSSDWSVVI